MRLFRQGWSVDVIRRRLIYTHPAATIRFPAYECTGFGQEVPGRGVKGGKDFQL